MVALMAHPRNIRTANTEQGENRMTGKTSPNEHITDLLHEPHWHAVLSDPQRWVDFADSPAGPDLLDQLLAHDQQLRDAQATIDNTQAAIDTHDGINILHNQQVTDRMTSEQLDHYRDARIAYEQAHDTRRAVGDQLDRWRGERNPGWLTERLNQPDVQQWAAGQIRARLADAADLHQQAQTLHAHAARLATPAGLSALVPVPGQTVAWNADVYTFNGDTFDARAARLLATTSNA
jgi:hypothetical protein